MEAIDITNYVGEIQKIKMDVRTMESYDPIHDDFTWDYNLILDAQQIREGLIRQMTSDTKSQVNASRNFIVLLAIVAHMDKKNKAFPSQTKIAEITGMTRQTVSKAIADLEGVTVKGQPLIQTVKSYSKTGKVKTTYYFMRNKDKPVSQEAPPVAQTVEEKQVPKEEEHVLQGEAKPYNSRDIIMLWCEKYKEEHKVEYLPNYRIDGGQIKNKLIGKFSNEDIKLVIEYIIKNYRTKWATKGYPTPTIGMLVSWLFNSALPLAKAEANKDTEIENKEKEIEGKFSNFNPLDYM